MMNNPVTINQVMILLTVFAVIVGIYVYVFDRDPKPNHQ